MDFFNALLQAADRRAYVNGSHTIDQLCVVCVEMMAETVAVDEAFQIFGVDGKLLWPENGTLRHRTVNWMRTRPLSSYLECLCSA